MQEARVRWSLEVASIAGVAGRDSQDPPRPLDHTADDRGDAGGEAGVVDRELHLRRVGAFEDHRAVGEPREERREFVSGEVAFDALHLRRRAARADKSSGGRRLWAAFIRASVQNLSLEIAAGDGVPIDEEHPANAAGEGAEDRRTTQPSEADEDDHGGLCGLARGPGTADVGLLGRFQDAPRACQIFSVRAGGLTPAVMDGYDVGRA